jgi:4-hydroxy-2-oxoheptanedioate aldolase
MIGKLSRSGEVALNGWITLPDAFATEVFGSAGWDCLSLDLQHGLLDHVSMVECLRAAKARDLPVLVRLPQNDPATIGRVLDAGAAGIICPLVSSAAEVAMLVDACRYPPYGSRSYGPIRSGLYEPPGADVVERSREAIICLPMIETRGALEAVEAILDVDGVSGVYVGPNDLGLALGLPPRSDREEPEFLAHCTHIAAAARARAKIAGIYCTSAAYAVRAIAMGFTLVTAGTDSKLLADGARDTVKAVRSAL